MQRIPERSHSDASNEVAALISNISSNQKSKYIAYMKDIITLDKNDTNVARIMNESFLYNKFRLTLKGFGILYGSTAGIPYFKVALDAGKGRIPLGYICGVSTIIAYGGSTIWIMLNLTNKLNPHARLISEITETRLKPNFRHIICISMGVVTSLSTIYVMSRYTKSLISIGMAYITEFAYKSMGYYELFEILYSLLGLRPTSESAITEDVLLSKEKFANIIQEQIIPYLLTHPEEIQRIFVWNNDLTDEENIEDFYFQLFTLIREVPQIHTSNRLRRLIQTGFLIIPLLNIITSLFFNSKTANVIWDNLIFVGISAAFLTIPHFALDVIGTTGSTGQMTDAARGRYTGGYFISRKANLGLYVICCILAGFSSYVDAFVVEDNLSKDSIKFFQRIALYSAIILLLANTFLEGFGSSVTANNFIITSLRYLPNQETTRKAEMVTKLTSFSTTLASLKSGFFYSSCSRILAASDQPEAEVAEIEEMETETSSTAKNSLT